MMKNTENMETVNKHLFGVSGILEKIEEIIEERIDININTNFPLSGGDYNPHIIHQEHAQVITEQGSHPKRSSFLADLATEFPLSGGEYER